MQNKEKAIEILADLVGINNSRALGYEKAAEACGKIDIDFQSIFNSVSRDSKQYAADLINELAKLGTGESAADNGSRKMYPVWMNLGASFTGYDRQAILEACETAEENVQKGYNRAFAIASDLDSRVMKIIINQKAQLKTAHKLIRNYRNARWRMTA